MGERTEVTKEVFFVQLRALSEAGRYAELNAYAEAHQDLILPQCTPGEADTLDALWSHAAMCAAAA